MQPSPSRRSTAIPTAGRASTDFGLLQRLRTRDPSALRELHRRHAGFVYAVARRIVGDPEDADEIVQQVFLQLWLQGFALDERRARLRSWLFVVARNRSVEHRRAGVPRPRENDRNEASERPASSGDGAGAQGELPLALPSAERERIAAAVDALSEGPRHVLELAFFDGCSHNEISARLQAPLGTVKSQLRRATQDVKARLAGEPEASECELAEGMSHPLDASVAAYALGALDAEDRVQFEAQLAAGDLGLWRRVREFESVTDALCELIDPVSPPAGAWTRLEARLIATGMLPDPTAEAVRSRPREVSGRRTYALAAAAILAFVFAVSSLWLDSERRTAEFDAARIRERLEDAEAALAKLREDVRLAEASRDDLRAQLDESRRDLDAITRPVGREITLVATPVQPQAHARAFVDPEDGRVWLAVDGLPALPPDQSYQLWLIVDDEANAAGLFETRAGKARLQASQHVAENADLTIAVTIEPAGGSPQPTGPMILSGS